MEQKLLELKPKRYLCPFCGEWHKWNLSRELSYYDSPSNWAELTCDRQEDECAFYFEDGYCYYRTSCVCDRANLDIDKNILIEDIVESSCKPQVTFSVPVIVESDVNYGECSECYCRRSCLICKLGTENLSRCMDIPFGFEFEQSDYNRISKVWQPTRKAQELQTREQDTISNECDLQKQLEQQQLDQQCAEELKKQVKENRRGITMANIFNMNMEFGPNKDNNIASTLMGIAVNNGESWRIYDKKQKQIIDVGDMQLGNLPIFVLPTTKLAVGDLIKDAGEYYFVMKVKTDSIQSMCAKTGEIKKVLPIKNVMGFSCYSKVIALSDSINMVEDFDVEKLAIMSAMCGQPDANENQNASMNQMLPLMLFKDKFGGDDDMTKMLLMSAMMSASAESGDQNASMNQMLPIMFLSQKDQGDDDMTKMFLMSTMMGGNTTGSNNMMMNYLMLDTFMDKKKKKKEQKAAKEEQPANPENQDQSII